MMRSSGAWRVFGHLNWLSEHGCNQSSRRLTLTHVPHAHQVSVLGGQQTQQVPLDLGAVLRLVAHDVERRPPVAYVWVLFQNLDHELDQAVEVEYPSVGQ